MRLAFLIWILAVILLSLLPLRFKLFLGTTGTLHSWGHYVVFMITTLLATWGAGPRTRQLFLAFLVVGFGMILEISEVFFYHNVFEWHDVLVDALGVFTGLVLLRFLDSRPTNT